MALLLAMLPSVADAAPVRSIVLIGGNTPHGAGVHESRGGILRLERELRAVPALRRLKHLSVRAYPDGWPADPAALDDAATIVWYFDGLDHHPLLDAARRERFARAMARGAGLVTFHQSSTLPPGNRDIDLIGWLGAARHGMIDRTVEVAALTLAKHPVARGVGPFAYRDEFYPTLRFAPAGVTPVLTAPLHLEAAPALPPTLRTVAWAFDRPGGGRSFGFTGLHYLAALDQPALRTLLMNAVVWTAGEKVPKRGVAAWK